MEIIWSHVSSPSGYRDGVYSVCVSSGIVYAVGFDELMGYGKQRYRVEGVDARDGHMIAKWVDDKAHSFASLYSCTAVGDRIYVFGATDRFWTIMVFDKLLNPVKRVDREKPYILPFSVVNVGRYIYVAGVEITPTGSTAIHVSRISVDDLSIVNSYTSNPKDRGAGAYSIAYNKKMKQIIVGGFDKIDGVSNWRIEYLTEDLNLIKISRPSVKGSITGLALDADGFIYTAGRTRIARISREGETLNTVTSPQAVKIYTSQESLPILGTNIAVATDNEAYILTNDTLSIVEAIRLSRGPQILSMMLGSMDADNERIYLASTQIATKDDWNWTILALKPRGRGFLRLFRR
ncbi:MAG: hypothetical protein QXM83_04010 [Ignisphaera sp.]